MHLHMLGEANVTDRCEDGAEEKKNEHGERGESPELNDQLMRQNPCSG